MFIFCLTRLGSSPPPNASRFSCMLMDSLSNNWLAKTFSIFRNTRRSSPLLLIDFILESFLWGNFKEILRIILNARCSFSSAVKSFCRNLKSAWNFRKLYLCLRNAWKTALGWDVCAHHNSIRFNDFMMLLKASNEIFTLAFSSTLFPCIEESLHNIKTASSK